MAKKKHYKSLPARLEDHKKEPKATGCIWVHKDFGRGESWKTHPCHYQNNGFEESKYARFNMYVPLQDKIDEVNRDKKKIREDAAGEYRQEVNKAREEMARQQERRASGEKLGRRDYWNFFVARERLKDLSTKARDFLQKHITGYGQSMHRLALNKKAWNVGHSIDESLVTREYLGGQGYAQAKKEGIKNPVNFAPERHGQRLGSWYPYDHEYHHIIPKGSLKHELLTRPKTTPFERRVSTIWESKWNMHNRQNIILLAENPIVAKIISLPPHCPWGAKGHKIYSDMVEFQLQQIANDMEADLSEEGEPHEVEKRAGANLRSSLEQLSRNLYTQIKSNQVFLS
jgi:hypothetical protein